MKKTIISLLLLLLFCAALPAAAETVESAPVPAVGPLFAETAVPAFLLSSQDLADGKWNPEIAKAGGKNVSPQLSWEPVPEAACYVIYMVDTNVMDFVHWMSNNVTETQLPQGWAPKGEYIGPYPPPFETHNYDVYVLALREPVDALKGTFNAANVFFAKNVLYLDAPEEGITGNLLGYGYLSGTYQNAN
jgi:phosphatidylethanolamine-binding protein (PEBP) family uncharacterized protein